MNKRAAAMRTSRRRSMSPLRKAASWWRDAAPPGLLVVGWFLIYASMAWRGGLWPLGLVDRSHVRAFVLGSASVLGVFRALRWHPSLRPGYLAWLRATPCGPGLPLPLGPVLLTSADAVVVAILVAASVPNPATALVEVPMAFLAGYLGVLGCLFLVSREEVAGFLLLCGLGLVALARDWIGLIIAAVLYAFAAWRFGRWLSARLQSDSLCAGLQQPVLPGSSALGINDLGWPLAPLSPKRRYPSISLAGGVAAAGLAAFWWCVFAMWTGLRGSLNDGQFYLVAYAASGLAAFVRFLTYFIPHKAPTTLEGRLSSGNLLVPGYDQILLAPILAAAAPLGASQIAAAVRADPEIGSPAALFAGLACALVLGPRLETFALTGSHTLRSPEEYDERLEASLDS